jgi:hypothetical protein
VSGEVVSPILRDALYLNFWMCGGSIGADGVGFGMVNARDVRQKKNCKRPVSSGKEWKGMIEPPGCHRRPLISRISGPYCTLG